MAGAPTQSARLGWHGLAGDRRFAFRRVEDRSGFPWLSATHLPELLLYRPLGQEEGTGEPLPTHVGTPSGQEFELHSEVLRAEVAARTGSDVELMWLRNGTFDDAVVSVISLATVAAVGREAGVDPDLRRFRPNIVLETDDQQPFNEGSWVGRTLVFGGTEPHAAVCVTADDVRCMMINLDPDTARQDARVMRAVVQRHGNVAGVYGAVVRTGTLHVGQEIWLT
ncbi:MAG TPA: MOSC domain-containing protein [Gemmatimonadales bacterium]|nr:MOSC domain-containing protein [Gemmatimonadales bacterium]